MRVKRPRRSVTVSCSRARLICDTMKWMASKLKPKPKRYGDKIDHNVTGSLTIGIKRNERVNDA